MEVLLTILAALGSTIIITRSWIFEKIRETFCWFEITGILFSCPTCMGFWNGLFYALLFGFTWKEIICAALITSLAGYLFTMVEDIVDKYLSNGH